MILMTVLLNFALSISESHAEMSPSIIGWTNVLVPGSGATLRGDPLRGVTEATLEIGLYYGGTFGARELDFTIDGSVVIPPKGQVYRPLMGQVLQEAGLKLHMFDTFYNYQQASLAIADSDREKSNSQPLYRGTWLDMLKAPFQWKNLSSPWTFPLVFVSSAYLIYYYSTTPVEVQKYRASSTEDFLYGFTQIGAIPFGGLFGEEAFFRGFVQREMRYWTSSAILSIGIQSALFTLLHPNDLRPSALASGIYFGIMTNHFDGDLGPAIAAHFWVNVVSGITTYWQWRKTQRIGTPFDPPVSLRVQFPI